MRAALLRGRDHTELGAIELVAEGPAAIALSKGGAQKTYSHVDPNEDAVGYAIGEAGMLLAVADGHDGASGAEAAVATLLAQFGDSWTSAGAPASSAEHWSEVACSALSTLNSAVLRDGADRRSDAAPTTLSFALVRPHEDSVFHASIGDSHVFVHREACNDVGWATTGRNRAYFLGYESQGPDGLREKSVTGLEVLGNTSALVLATDGVSERAIGFADPVRALGEVIAQIGRAEVNVPRAVELCRGFAEAASSEQQRNRAGDNIACAVLWLGD